MSAGEQVVGPNLFWWWRLTKKFQTAKNPRGLRVFDITVRIDDVRPTSRETLWIVPIVASVADLSEIRRGRRSKIITSYVP